MDLMDIEDLVPEEIGGVCGMAAPIIAYIFIGVAILFNREWFRWYDEPLSNLGEAGASYSNIFNVGLVLAGILGFLFAMAIFRLIETRVGVLGVSLFTAGMIFLILIGIFPEGTTPHIYVAIAFYALAIAGITLVGIDQMLDFTEPMWGIFFLSSVGLSLAAVYLVYTIPYDIGLAIPEFIGAIPIMQMALVWGARLYFE